MKKTVLFFILAALMAACEKNVVIDIPEKAPRLVVDAWLGKNDLIKVSVGKSQHILKPVNTSVTLEENYTVKNAVPVVYENGAAIDTLVYDPNEYRYKSIRNKRIRDGFTYTVKVTAPGFGMAEVMTIVPSQSVIAEVKRVRNARRTSDGIYKDEITIRLDDPAEKNYYLISFFAPDFGGGQGYPIQCVSTTDKDLEAIGYNTDPTDPENCYDGSRMLMKDDHFNGLQKVVKVYIESGMLMDNQLPGGTINRPFVKVYRITEDYFKFIKSYDAFYNAGDNPFAEPVNVYTNVKNGYGIFSAYTVAADTLR